MRGGKRIFELIRRAAFPALALIVVGTFAGHAIAGPNGILAWGGYHRALLQRQAELPPLGPEKGQRKQRPPPPPPPPPTTAPSLFSTVAQRKEVFNTPPPGGVFLPAELNVRSVALAL